MPDNPKPAFRTRKFTVNPTSAAGDSPSSLDESARTVDLTIVSETDEILTYDWDLGWVPEILVMSGGTLPDAGQVPLIDSHDRYSVKSVLGSVRNLSFEGTCLSGRAHYSSVEDAQQAFTKLQEGHLTDYSGGFRVHKEMKLDENESTEISGRTYHGPAVLLTQWTLKEVSTCPIGADPSAKARAETHNTDKEKRPMPGNHDDKDTIRDETHTPAPETASVDIEKEREAAAAKARTEEQDRIRSITAMCERHDCNDLTESLISGGKSVDQARTVILEQIENRSQKKETEMPGFRVEVVVEARDKFREAAEHALCFRAGIEIVNPAMGYDDLTGYSMVELARRSLNYANRSDRGTPVEMVGRALTSSDFPIILANIANKSLADSFETADETWQTWCAEGSVNDFKIHTLARVSEADDLDEIAEDGEYRFGNLDEAMEQYRIATYGKKGRISRVAIINDDLSALTDIPSKHGEAAARKIGDVVYAVVTANSAMGDGVALFHATHKNLAETAGAITTPTMSEGILAMASHKDLKGKRRLNIRPQFILAPPDMEAATEEFFQSTHFDISDTSATRTNIYAGNRYKRIYESRLSDDSKVAWYMLGAKGKTVKVFFLHGNKKPYMESRNGWNVDGLEYKVRIDAGAKALDWKTMYRNAGA